MPEIKILPILVSILIALVFFALGRVMVMLMGTTGILIVFVLLAVFYFIWWRNYQRSKTK